MKHKIFLGGTCNDSTWREKLIANLQVDYFNPVVEDWTPECQENERNEKLYKCNIHLYVITSEMIGAFSIAEAVDSSRTEGVTTILHVQPEGFEVHALKSLSATVDLVNANGGIAYIDQELDRTARVLNYAFKK
jgi:hypothetical protein